MYRSILVGLDGSPSAARALREAVRLARRDGARLTLISVAAPPRWRFMSPYLVPYPTDADLERQAERVVEEAAELVPDDVPVCTLVRRGPAVPAILNRVEAGEHDLVLVGSRGRGPVRAALLGSLSRAIRAQCPVPVLVVGEPSPVAEAVVA